MAKSTVNIKSNALSSTANNLGIKMVSEDTIHNMFELVQKLSSNSQLYEMFKKDPNKVIQQEVPDLLLAGAHFHTVDSNNTYFPAEGGAAAQVMAGEMNPGEPWVRIEIRTGVGPLCALLCGQCDNGKV